MTRNALPCKRLSIVVSAALFLFLSGCCTAPFGRESGTTYVKDAVQPYIQSGELPGAISVLYKDGIVKLTRDTPHGTRIFQSFPRFNPLNDIRIG